MGTDIAIRPYRHDDAQSLYEAARESLDELMPWFPWCHAEYSLKEAEQWTASQEQLFVAGSEYAFAIVNPAGRFLGGCGLNQIRRIHRFGNLGYWVRRSEMGRGVAAAAIRSLAGFAFTQTDLIRLEILCAAGNSRSQRAAEKAGAMREGIVHDRLLLGGQVHDAVMYALVKSRWVALEPT
jgi:ribosomal-protein-serine acetyltransferase